MKFLKRKVLPLLLAFAMIVPQSGCAAPISASALSDDVVWNTADEAEAPADTGSDDLVVDVGEEDLTDVPSDPEESVPDAPAEDEPVIDIGENGLTEEEAPPAEKPDQADTPAGEDGPAQEVPEFPEDEDPDTFADPLDLDDLAETVTDSLEEEGIEAPEELDVDMPEDPLERLQYNIDRLPDPEFYETIADFNEAIIVGGKYSAFASALADEYYALSEEEQETLDLARLEAFFAFETSLVMPLAGDSDRDSLSPQVLPEAVYNSATFPEEFSHLVFYTRPFKKADEIGSGYRVQLRETQRLLATNTSKNNDVWFKLNRIARIDEQYYDLKIYTWTSRAATTLVLFEDNQICLSAAGNNLSWNDQQPVVYMEMHFINSDTGQEEDVKGAFTIADIDWHWTADLGLGPTDPNNTSKRESVAVMKGGVRAYLDQNTTVNRQNAGFGNFGNYGNTDIGGIPGAGWYWGTTDVDKTMPESQVTFAFNSTQGTPLTLAYYGSWHYATAVDSTISEIHYNIAPKSQWFPREEDLSPSCQHAEKDHCIHVDTNVMYGSYSLTQYQDSMNVKPDSTRYKWHGWYTDKACKNPAPASWKTTTTNTKMLYGWWEKVGVTEGSTDVKLTKSLEQTNTSPEGRINNQDTWNILLTQEYIDDRSMERANLKYAPLGSYLNLVIDQTVSMKGAPLESLNTAMENLVNQALRENQLRMENAKKGEYADIDGTVSDAELKAVMDEHLIHIDRVVGFNKRVQAKSYNGKTVWDMAPTTDAEADALKKAMKIEESDLGTGTALADALEYMDDQLSRLEHTGELHISQTDTIDKRIDQMIVLLDGMPDVRGTYYSSKTTSAKGDDVRDSLEAATGIKEQGVRVYAIWDRGIAYETIKSAVEANNGLGDLNQLAGPFSNQLQPIFMGLLSSDSPKGGNIPYVTNKLEEGLNIFYLDRPNYTWNREASYTVNEHSENGFGKYSFFGNRASDVVSIMRSVVSGIIAEGNESNLTTYYGAGSYVYDVISDPFEVTNVDSVQVYAIPRIPERLDGNGAAVDVVKDPDDPRYGMVRSFRWAEEIIDAPDGSGETESEWLNITNQVTISATGGVVKVSGWDYETNALTQYDKDLLKKTNANDPFIYEPGDYGYKILVKIPINAKKTFGGNNIETNNSDTSAFYPSIPGGPTSPTDPDYVVRWPENKTDNPDGNPWIKKYDSPKVNLYVDYGIVADSINVYAPQTANVLNIVTDAMGSIWKEDPMYQSTKQAVDTLENNYAEALKNANKAAASLTENSTEEDKARAEALYLAAEQTREEWIQKTEVLRSLESYRPDGLNNAFVDIDYEFRDPNGQLIGTMHIPHGRAYVEKPDGTANIEWQVDGGATKRLIQKSGIYNISCTVTPVDTKRAPGGHVYTAEDALLAESNGGTEADAAFYPYFSEDYSPTGSTADGRETAKTLTEEGSAYLFYLEITAKDSRLEPRQTIDFFEGNEYMHETGNPHIQEYRWVCTDGKTPSDPANEPGADKIHEEDPDFIPSLIVGLGEPNLATSQIPQSAFDDGLALDIMGTTAVGATDGIWVPVGCYVSRKCGDINKSTPIPERVKLVDKNMTDEDDIWGIGINSVEWKHECEDLDNCTFTAFQDAQRYSDGTVGKIRYLIHVAINPVPVPDKETETPVITKGNDIKWNVSLTNNDEATNKRHLSSDFHLVDVLPYNNDKNDNGALLYPGGSKFGGELKYTRIAFDFTDAPSLFERIKSGDAAVYLTSQVAVRTAAEEDIRDLSENGPLKWQKMELTIDEAAKTATVAVIPDTTYAFNLVGRLKWEESVNVNLVANMKNPADQQTGDYYHNRAVVYTGNGMKYTDSVETVVGSLYISGTVWEDIDVNGLLDGREKKIDNIPVTLYQEYDPNNGGQPDRTVGNLKLVKAFDSDLNEIPTFKTEADGNFHFDNVQKGTYYVIADHIPDKYAVTIKGAGTDAGTKRLDSEADEAYIANADKKIDNSAIIRKIVVTDKPVEYQNIGLKLILGSVKVWKSLNEIYYPTTMTEEEMEDYQLVFVFNLKNVDTGRVYSESVRLTKDSFCLDKDGRPQAHAVFKDLPLGTYELSEQKTAQYGLSEIIKLAGTDAKWDNNKKTMTIKVTAKDHDFEVHAVNQLIKDPPGGDENGVRNWVNVRVPIKLDITYVGSDPISDHKLASYTFKASDFDPKKGGDMVVTYDDGTTISLSKGNLKFENVTLTPGTVTNNMNSGINKVTISGYYTEKGRTVTDSFEVRVDLKPIHKFLLVFDANSSFFNDRSTQNNVNFAYDEFAGGNRVTKGEYKDVANGKLNTLTNFRFIGWNTARNGSGINYDSFTALNAIGKDSSIDQLTLYAHWASDVTFNANGGTISAPSNATAAEKALNGKTSGKIAYSLGQNVATRLEATKNMHRFISWNTKPDGSGTDIVNYGACKGPVTFYAIYYKSDYDYVGHSEAFTAPVDGTYQVEAWGASGGSDKGDVGGMGGYTVGRVHLKRGTKLYVYVGQEGIQMGDDDGNVNRNFFNGGGGFEYGRNGIGGGATSISTSNGAWNNDTVLNNRILVAGGGGGGGKWSEGGYAGGLVGQTVVAGFNGDQSGASGGGQGATQTSAGARGGFGYGGTSIWDGGGGGGGWYGGGAGNNKGYDGPGTSTSRYDYGAGGGSSYLSGYSGCQNSHTGYRFTNGQLKAGNATITEPNGSKHVGHRGAGYARFILLNRD